MASRTKRFERKSAPPPQSEPEEEVARFSPEEEATLLAESHDLKTKANEIFVRGEYEDAIEAYSKALDTCPRYLYYERAVLKSNVAACYLKLEQWKDAVKAAGESLDLLDEAEGKKKASQKPVDDVAADASNTIEPEKAVEEEEADEEIISAGAAKAEDTSARGKKKADIERIRTKALMRRGKARMELGSWSSLQGAQEDYNLLSAVATLSEGDKKVVKRALAVLPARTKVAQEKEMGDMMGKLKDLGNGILKPFGLSTDNFQMVKDETTGGYSMNFNQGNK